MKTYNLFLFFILSLSSINSFANGFYGVQYHVEYSEEKCSKEYPLMVTFKNRSFNTVSSVEFRIQATKKGYSSQVYVSSRLKSDKVLKRLESYTACYKLHAYSSYPGIKDEDLDMDPMNLMMKYGLDVSGPLIAARAADSKAKRLDKNYAVSELSFSVIENMEY